ncbi:hypothetical protein G7054_g6811 [Neopestalotiopsis clavispora]|nr:hypothetical protein G7054_g6811 [Neopestalotiopsis clavispora]
MRLLDTQTFQVSEFLGGKIPKYAILSHTWDDDEVTYQDIQSLQVARGMQGFTKVEGACQLAGEEGFKYIWIDTCCIDKSSSAELTEAINSMYSWYQKSAKCYAYLADVNDIDFPDDTTEFEESRWFKRGWTLQELIAPGEVVFHSCNWKRLGDKMELRVPISRVTGIDTSILAGADHKDVCVARKMFWASRRQTKRIEDMAYCLLGIFSVNMPLVYGEGKHAFIRLQKKIVQKYDDQSIFAWTLPTEEINLHQHYGLLAESPAAFKYTGKTISPFHRKNSSRQTTKVLSTGLEIELLLQPPTYLCGLLQTSRARYLLLFPLLFASIAAPRTTFFVSITSASIIFMRRLQVKTVAARHKVRPTDYLNTSRNEKRSYYRAALDCQLINPQAFKRGISNKPARTWPLLGFTDTCVMLLKAFLLKKTPWEFQKVSVEHEPTEIRPVGFRLLHSHEATHVIDGYPAQQWCNHDNILRRNSLNLNGIPSNHAMSEATESGTTVADGVVRLGFSEDGWSLSEHDQSHALRTFLNSLDVCLILGMRSIYRPTSGDWVQQPWCRFVTKRSNDAFGDLMNITDGGSSTKIQRRFGMVLEARIEELNHNGLYNVRISLLSGGHDKIRKDEVTFDD